MKRGEAEHPHDPGGAGTTTDERAAPASTFGGARADTPWRPLDRWILLTLVATGLLSQIWLVHPFYDVVGDGSIYLTTTSSLLAGEGYSYLEEPYRVRPPGLPLLLAPAMATLGLDHHALNLIVSICGLLAVVLLYVYERPRLGAPLTALVAAAIFLNPGFQKYSTQMLSDVPGLAAALLCLLVARWSDARPSLRRELVLGMCIGLSTYLRSALVLLLPALWAARALAPMSPILGGSMPFGVLYRRLLPMTLVALAVMLPWSLRNAAVAPEGEVDQLVIYDYATAQWHESWTDPSSRWLTPMEVLARSEQRVYQLAKSLGSRMQWGTFSEAPSRREFDAWEVFVSLVLILGLCVSAWRYRDATSFFALGTLAVLLIYFDYHARLALPVYVFGFVACTAGAKELLDRWLGQGRGASLLGVAIAALIGVDFDPGRGWDGIQAKHLDLQERCLALERIATPETRLATTIGWHYTMCLSRPVFGIAQIVFREEEASAAEQVIDRYEVDTVFLDRTHRYDRRFAPYFEAVYGPPARTGVLDYWRVRPAPGARPAER